MLSLFHDNKVAMVIPRLCFYQTRSAWSLDQGSTKKRSVVHNFVPTVTQNLVTVGVKLLIGEWFLFDPWSMDQADLVW